ncbi:Stk1 family PASTA domain-containing Ser/Thr kinase [Bacillota bacterium LX-D]|nr:Stk1 family PASTA domain-containing Ser/Thr kinase [Bacillota bacterium LX-D]
MIGKILGNRYEVIEKIGGGGMAVVYKGKDKLLNRTVTIKVLREQYVNETDFIRRFQREAQAVASLSHPNIVSIYDVGHEEDFHYLVMEYVEGSNLKEVIQQEAPLEPLKAIDYLMQILDALEHAHEHMIIHRDIKPHNILVTKSGKLKVTDFGIAQAASTAATVTYTGMMVGSVQYISPEQAKGEITGAYSDLYSAGVVLYELLTGKLPFSGENAIGIAIKHIEASVTPPSQLVHGIPPELEYVVLKAMAKDPKERYSSAGEMRLALEKVHLDLSGELPTQVLPTVKTGIRQNREPLQRLQQQPQPSKETINHKPKPLVWFLVPLFLLAIIGGFWLGMEQLFAVKEVKVPSVEGKTLAEAEIILSKAGLHYQINRRVSNSDVPENTIVKQDPQPGETIKKTQPILLDVSTGPDLKTVPGVIGLSERAARIAITNAGFVVKNVLTVNDEQIPKGQVVDQQPKPETQQPVGTEVTLTVSLGSPQKFISMPDLLYKSLDEAKKEIENSDLEIGTITEEISDKYFSGQVIEQSIPAGRNVLSHQKVDLKVSKGPGPEAQMASVEFEVVDDGATHKIQIIVSDSKGTREEYNEIHESGESVSTTVEYYGKGTLELLQDGKVIYKKAIP